MVTKPKVVAIVERCQELFEDLNFNAVKAWKAAAPGRKVKSQDAGRRHC